MQGKNISLHGRLIPAIFRFHNLNDMVAHFPARRVALRVDGRFAIPLHVINLTILASKPPIFQISNNYSQGCRIVGAVHCSCRARQ